MIFIITYDNDNVNTVNFISEEWATVPSKLQKSTFILKNCGGCKSKSIHYQEKFHSEFSFLKTIAEDDSRW